MKKVICCFIIIINAIVVNAQWKKVENCTGGYADQIQSDGKSFYAVAQYYGIIKSTDNGNSWQVIYDDTAELFSQFSDISVSQNRVLLSSYNHLALSVDSGKSFNNISCPVFSIKSGIVIGSHIVVSGDNEIALSNDDGLTWTNQLTLTGNFSVYKANGKVLGINNVNLKSYLSLDSGFTWTLYADSAFDWWYDRSYISGDTILVHKYNENQIRYSINLGSTWTIISNPNTSINFHGAVFCEGDTIYCAVSDSIIRTTDHGLTWNFVGSSLGFWANSIIGYGKNFLVAGSWMKAIQKLVRSTGKFINQSNGINSTYLYELLAKGDTLIAPSYKTTKVSYDNGYSWRVFKAPFRYMNCIIADTGSFYTCEGNKIYKSVDGGKSFYLFTKILNSGQQINQMVYKNGIVYCASPKGVNAVNAQTGSYTNLGYGFKAYSISIIDTTIFITTGEEILMSGISGSLNWTDISTGTMVPNKRLNHLSSFDSVLYLSATRVYKFHFNSMTWTSGGLPFNPGPLSFTKTGDAMAVCRDGIHILRNSPGAKWDTVNLGLNIPLKFTLNYASCIAGKSEFFLTGASFPNAGLWYYPYSQLNIAAGSENNNDIQSSISVFPNPASTTISLCIPEVIKLSNLKIFDMTGKLIEDKDVSDHLLEFDISYLLNGFYILKLTDNKNEFVQKLVVNH